jgi:hypothetical protein
MKVRFSVVTGISTTSFVKRISSSPALQDTRVVSAFAFVKPRRAKQSVKSK